MKSVQLAAWLLITSLVIYLLIIAKHLIIPLIVAISIWYLINTLAGYFQNIRILNIALPRSLSFLFAAVTIIAVFAFSINIILDNAEKMVAAAPRYEQTLDLVIADALSWMDFEETPSLARLLRQIDLRPLVVSLGAGISNFAGQLVLIIIYIIFLLLEQRFFKLKFQAFFSHPEQYRKGMRILERINTSIQTYITVKTFVSFLTATLSYIGMRIIGLDFAAFWAFLIFLMNFIPSIGSITATALVSLFALLQFEDLSHFFLALLVVGSVQLAIGNYLDPRLMGKSLNISPLIVILSLALWGSIWGVIGMALSVPIMVSIMIILSQFPQTAALAVLLSQDGRILELESTLDPRKVSEKELEEREKA